MQSIRRGYIQLFSAVRETARKGLICAPSTLWLALSNGSDNNFSQPFFTARIVTAHKRARTLLILILSCSCLFGLSLHSHASSTSIAANASEDETQQRQNYLDARKSLKRGQLTKFRRQLKGLGDYPLTPYLQYKELKRRLHRLPHGDIHAFLSNQADSYLAERLQSEWLTLLAGHHAWKSYREFYERYPSAKIHKSVSHQCFYLQAQLKQKNTPPPPDLYQQIETLWNVGHFQPNACGPLFKQWAKAGYRTNDLLWQRHQLALKANKQPLARYVRKKMTGALKQQALLLAKLHRQPALIKQHQRFSTDSERQRATILHGLQRLARKDSQSALEQWYYYRRHYNFSPEQQRALEGRLVERLSKHNHYELIAQLPSRRDNPGNFNRRIAEPLIRDALRRQDWGQAYHWLQMLPPELRQHKRWLYWRARVVDQLQVEDPTFPTPNQIYQILAQQRGFYGFLAAGHLGTEYQLEDQTSPQVRETLNTLEQQPAVQRIKELLAINHRLSAQREWRHLIARLPADQLVPVSQIAHSWGWYSNSIQTLISAKQWNEIQLRFPLGYRQYMADAASDTQIDTSLLYAIARQESAFRADAKSPAGALGLMQLMPRTARYTARRNGLHYRQRDLLKPQKNITLGSRYLQQLLKQFNGNPVLATAAYNAGPRRVKQWLADDHEIPHDIWIETIPFSETRNYVQNVLAFSVIYSYRLGSEYPQLQLSAPLSDSAVEFNSRAKRL